MALMAPVASLLPSLVLTRPDLGIRVRPPAMVLVDSAFLAAAETSSAADLATNLLLDLIGDSGAGSEATSGVLLGSVGDAASDLDSASGIGVVAGEASSGLEGVTRIGVGTSETSSGTDGGLGLMVVVGESTSATDVVTRIFLAGIGETANGNEAGFAGAILALRIESREFTKNIESRQP